MDRDLDEAVLGAEGMARAGTAWAEKKTTVEVTMESVPVPSSYIRAPSNMQNKNNYSSSNDKNGCENAGNNTSVGNGRRDGGVDGNGGGGCGAVEVKRGGSRCVPWQE